MVYSAAVSGKVFSLKHTNDGKSVIDCYSPENGTTAEFLCAADDHVILATSVYDECVYALMHDETKGYHIVKYDAYGNTIDSWDTAYVNSILTDSQVGRFQVMNETFFLENFCNKVVFFGLTEPFCLTCRSGQLQLIPQGHTPSMYSFAEGQTIILSVMIPVKMSSWIFRLK